jgi:glutamate 5-kinase
VIVFPLALHPSPELALPVPTAAAILASARRVVVKVGSALLIDAASGAVDRAWLSALADDLARLRARGQQVIAVSSGAVALGRRRLGLSATRGLDEKQAAAAAGQSLLMRAWEEALEPHALAPAQLLLTRDDTEQRRRWLNARATIEALLDMGAVPVINENDTVATEELRYGDNDRLAARAAQLARADVLVLLSDVDGLYTADPRRDPAARHIPEVAEIGPEILAMASGANAEAGVGTGGMTTKLQAARIARAAGCSTLIAKGGAPQPLQAIEAGARATVLTAPASPAAAYKQWIAGSLSHRGAVVVDAGAAEALDRGKSLLPSGITAAEGDFRKGDCILVRDGAGRSLAVGVAGYDAAEVERIRGRRSGEIEAALGYRGPAEVIHRDDLVRLEGTSEVKP